MCGFFCYICPVGFDFMLPCRFIGFPARDFFIYIYLFRIFATAKNRQAVHHGLM